MPKVAVPITFAGMSRRGSGLPKSLNSDGFLSGGGGIVERSPTKSTSSPNVANAAAVLAADLALAHGQLGDRQAGLAACRAQQQVARHGRPPVRIGKPGVARRRRTAGAQKRPARRPTCPPPNAAGRRPGPASSGEKGQACRSASRHCDRRPSSGRVLDLDLVPAAASISSATSMASAVWMPCPISARGTATVHRNRRAPILIHPLRPASSALDVEQRAGCPTGRASRTNQKPTLSRPPPDDAADDRLAPGELHGAPLMTRPVSPPRDARRGGSRCRLPQRQDVGEDLVDVSVAWAAGWPRAAPPWP